MWRTKLEELLTLPALSQRALAEKLGTSPATLSRLLTDPGKEPSLRVYFEIERLHREAFEMVDQESG